LPGEHNCPSEPSKDEQNSNDRIERAASWVGLVLAPFGFFAHAVQFWRVAVSTSIIYAKPRLVGAANELDADTESKTTVGLLGRLVKFA